MKFLAGAMMVAGCLMVITSFGAAMTDDYDAALYFWVVGLTMMTVGFATIDE